MAAAKVLNTKHSKMDDLVEPFSVFGNASYALKVPERGGDTEQGDKHNISCEIILPNFVSISVSPSVIETATKVTEIARQSSVEVYEALASDLQVQAVRDLWSFLDKVGTRVPSYLNLCFICFLLSLIVVSFLLCFFFSPRIRARILQQKI